MDYFEIIILVSLLLIFELLYFKIANKYNIIDKPNHRSSHTRITIRGGGVIFCLSILLAAIFNYKYPYFITGLLIISVISFIDDVKPLSNLIRLIGHFVAVALLFYEVNLLALSLLWILFAFVFVIGTINAINFMDGINGITGGYGLIALCTLLYINKAVLFVDVLYLWAAIIAVLIFCFFNFRKKARCFAGDVGSISLSFIVLFFLLLLIIKTQNFSYILLLLIYGLDSVTTIIFRILRRENIFKAHRSHFYQYLANEKQIPHTTVSLIYMAIQAGVNVLALNVQPFSVIKLILCIFGATLIVVFLRIALEGKQKLLKNKC